MALETTEEFRSDAWAFQITHLPFKKSRTGMRRLLGLLAAFAEGANGLQSGAEVDFGKLINQLDDATLSWFSDAFCDSTKVRAMDGDASIPLNGVMQETVFGGDLALWLRFVAFSLEYNFGDFFRELVEQVQSALATTTPTENPFRPTSTG